MKGKLKMEKSKLNYTLTKSVQSAAGQSFVTFGIAGDNISFEDVSTDRAIVEEMISRLNKEQLEESQLMYFIEDELNRSMT